MPLYGWLTNLAIVLVLGAAIAWLFARRTSAAHRSEGRYALAMEAAGDGHTDWNLQTGEHYISPRLLQICGYAPGTVFRNRAEWVQSFPFHSEDRPKWEQAVAAHFAGLESHFKMELRIVVHGEVRWTAFHFLSTRDAEGTPIRWTGSIGEITDRKRAESALRLSEERYAHALEVTEEGHFDWNVRTDQLFASAAAIRIVNVPPDAEYRSRGDFQSRMRFHPEDWPRISEEWRAALAGRGLEHEFEYRILRGEEPRTIRAHWKVFRDADGAAERVIGVVSDVTERKRVEEALRRSEERYALAMNASEAGYWDWSLTTDEYYVSPRMLEMTRMPSDTAFASRAESLARMPLHPDDRTKWAEAVRAHFAGKGDRLEMELRMAFPDEIRWVRMNGICVRDVSGAVVRWSGSAADITERKRVEEELRSRQEMLDVAQKSARVMAFEWKGGANKGENNWPPDLEAMHGLPPGGYDGSIMGWKKLIHPEDLAAVNEALVLGERTGDIALQYRVVHPDKSVHWVLSRGRMFVDAAGRTARIVGFAQEITQSKQAEADLRKMEEELRRAQRLESIGTLAGGIAHDFNNILGAILGYGEMAARDAKKGTRLRRDLDSIMAAGERGRGLVDRILAFSRSGVGERVPVHVQAVVREALGQIAASLPANVVVARRLRAGRAAMLGDSTQVHQVVMNLASNAVQAMSKGGVLRVVLETARIDKKRSATVGSIVPGDYIVLKVSDAGDGIPDDVLERIFDPFFTTKEVGTGSGLGLSLVHGIVTNVEGAIDVATELRKGTTFTVYLPRRGDAPEMPADEDRPLPRGTGERVLVVDDEEPLVRLATETLESLGYAPVSFTSSTAALAAFRADPGQFDAVLTDERMPGLSGSALIREVRAIREAIPVVLMSGYLGMESVEADVVVRKPLSARDLAASMARALEP